MDRDDLLRALYFGQTGSMVLAFKLPRSFLENRDNPVMVELFKYCGLELHFAMVRTGYWLSPCGPGGVREWHEYDTPLAVEWKTLDGTGCFHKKSLALKKGMIVEQSGISEGHGGAPVLVAWPTQKNVQAVSLIDFPRSIKLLKQGSQQDVEALRFLVTNCESGQEATLLNICLDWHQKDLAVHLIKHVEHLTEPWAEPFARAVSDYGWEECDGGRLILAPDEVLASLVIHLETCGCHLEAVKVADQLWKSVAARVKYIRLKPRIIVLSRMLQDESLQQQSLQKMAEDPESAMRIMRESASLIQLRYDDRMIDIFKKLVRSSKASGERIRNSLWLGDASLVDEVLKDLTGGEDYVGELLQDEDFITNFSSAMRRRTLRRLLEMRLAFLGSNEPEYTCTYAPRFWKMKKSQKTYAPRFKKMRSKDTYFKKMNAEAYSGFRMRHMKWLGEVPKIKELLQVFDYLDERTHYAFSQKGIT